MSCLSRRVLAPHLVLVCSKQGLTAMPLQAGLIGAFGDRVPKAVQAAVEIITQLVRCASLSSPGWAYARRSECCMDAAFGVSLTPAGCSEFGCKAVPGKPILAALPKLFEAKQEPVRDAVKKLMVCCFLGDAVLSPPQYLSNCLFSTAQYTALSHSCRHRP